MNKFQVGQKVKYESKHFPTLNGVYTVAGSDSPNEGDTLVRNGEQLTETLYWFDEIAGYFAESALSAVE